MASLVNKVIIANAQAEKRFLANDEMQQLSAFFQRAEISIAAARKLRDNAEKLVRGAAATVYATFPHYIASSTGETQKLLIAKCLRDIDYCLRIITYSLVSRSTDLIDDSISDLPVVFRSFNLEFRCLLEALRYIRSNHGLTDQEATEANIYIDYTIDVVARLEHREAILKQLQDHFATIAPGVSLADELIAERREEAKRELKS